MKNIADETGRTTPLRIRGLRPGTYWLEGPALVTVRRSVANGDGVDELLPSPEPSWILSEQAVEVAFIMEAVKVQVTDASTGTLYECDMEYFFRHSTLVKRGHERLRRLALTQWTQRHAEGPAAPQHLQLLAGGSA